VTAAEIVRAFGGSRSGRWWRCVCPVHGSRTGQSTTLALRDAAHGLVVHCRAGCSRDDILAELRRRGLLGGVRRRGASSIDDRTAYRPDRERRIEIARRIWDAASNARETAVEGDLAVRGITINPPPMLRYAPALRQDGTKTLAMVDARGIWRRRDRASLGPIRGGAVRFAPAAEVLMVGEGIETCLAAMQATNTPVWAALSTSGLKSLVLPAIVKEVIILADHDLNEQASARPMRPLNAGSSRAVGCGSRCRPNLARISPMCSPSTNRRHPCPRCLPFAEAVSDGCPENS